MTTVKEKTHALQDVLFVEESVEAASRRVEADVLALRLGLNVRDDVNGVLRREIAAEGGAAGAAGRPGDAVDAFFFPGDGVELDTELWQVLIKLAVVGEGFAIGGGTGLLAQIDVVHIGHDVFNIVTVPGSAIGKAGRNFSKRCANHDQEKGDACYPHLK